MKYPAVLPFAEILPQLHEFDTIIDVRSPAEFALGRIDGSLALPGNARLSTMPRKAVSICLDKGTGEERSMANMAKV